MSRLTDFYKYFINMIIDGESLLIKVLIVIPSVGTGGAERLVLDLFRLIDKNKFDVTLLCYYDTKPEAYRELIQMENINIVFLDKKLGLDLSMFSKVKKIVSQINPMLFMLTLTLCFI